MRRLVVGAFAVMLGLPFAGMVCSALAASSDLAARSEPLGQAVSIPSGWHRFCGEQPDECIPAKGNHRLVKLDQETWQRLNQINILVNQTIVGIADDAHYGIYKRGISNWWTYPDDGKGNCNDYVLMKRKLLVEAGLPESALLLTVVLDHENDGHLVLTVQTDHGDFILDNLVDSIVPWVQTGYTFIKRQSASNPNVWIAIRSGGQLAASAGQFPAKTAQH